jgi:hypothetical protein
VRQRTGATRLTDEDLGGALTDPRDRAQQAHLLAERGDHLLDLGVQPLDHPGQVVDVLQVHPRQQRVMFTKPSRKRHRKIRELLAHHPTGKPGQHPRVTLPSDQRLHHRPRRHRGDTGGHRVELDSAVFQDLAQPLQLTGARLDKLLAVASHLPDRRDLRRRDETAAQQPHLAQLRQPLGVLGVGLAARDVLDVPGVDQQHLQPLCLAQGMKDWPPVHPGRFHRHMGDALGDQPADHLTQHRVERLELPQLLVALPRLLPRGADRHRHELFAHINPGDPRVHDLQPDSLRARPIHRAHPRSPQQIKRLRLAL